MPSWLLKTACTALFSLLVAAPAAAQFPGETHGAASVLPEGEGKELFATACSQCHDVTLVTHLREGEPRWREYVREMVVYGAQLSREESEKVIAYLAKNFGPRSTPLAAAAGSKLPAGAGKELVESRCALCHTLERVTIRGRSRQEWETTLHDMSERGAQLSAAEMQTLATYLAEHFGAPTRQAAGKTAP
jgi:mono/diheme cytochrome c family protein